LINSEINRYPDKDPKRIFIGGLSMGANLAIAYYLNANLSIGGIMSLYGMNPLSSEKMSKTSLSTSIPILMINNQILLNDQDIAITWQYISSLNPGHQDMCPYHTDAKLGMVVSNLNQDHTEGFANYIDTVTDRS
jgi:dienelactone hydrolase